MNIWKRKTALIITSVIILILIALIRKGILLHQNTEGIFFKQDCQRPKAFIFPYILTQPSTKFKLPHRLDEISGLSYFEQNKLMCIQDEIGAMYVFDVENGKVTEKFEFGVGRDCEDIEVINKSAYILQSNGTILQVKNFENGAPEVKKYNTRLSRKNDTEGLAFDDESNALLIACKGSPHLKKKSKALKGKKAVYRFDLDTKEIYEKPACIIDLECLKDPVFFSSIVDSFIELIKIFDPRTGDINFRPSGIAVHPKTKDIYIISSADRMLIVFNREGDMISAHKLDKNIFKQPEGICFNPEGDLFISNERKKGRANILRFDYRQ